MKLRLAVPALLLAALAACGSSDDGGSDPSASPSATPPSSGSASSGPASSPTSGSASPTTAAELVGTWRDEEADWTVRFAADGRFEMDYQGNEDFMNGTYTLSGGKIMLRGESTDVGTVRGSSLVFGLGTLTRR